MKVVIIDDNAANAMLIESWVQQLDDVETVCFNDSADGLAWCEANEPDLIFLDQMMPKMSGTEFLTRYRSVDTEAAVPIVMVTANADRQTLYTALEAGATDFLSKPFDPTEFLARTRNLLRLRANHLELKETIERLHYLATTDTLTETANRAHFFDRLNEEIDRARRNDKPLSLAVLDADRFKVINDTFGHAAGDTVLKTLADTARSMLRNHDIVGRLGGEEFAICMPETNLEEGIHVCERLRAAIEENRVQLEGRSLKVTVSIGVSQFDSKTDAADSLLKRADFLLYRAKDSGRNQVIGVNENKMSEFSSMAS